MINANELRIGNWVKYHDDDTLFKVVEIDTLGIRVENEEQNTWIEYDCFSPIYLTPEILEKCGFISNPYQDRYELGDIYIEYCGIRNICWIENAPHIQYFHQLQNYVYANTNEELNFKQ